MSGAQTTALVATFTPAPSLVDRAKSAERAYFDSFQAMRREAERAGLRIHNASTICEMFHRGCDLARIWERRCAQLTKQLQAVLASDAISPEQRESIVRAVTGSTRSDAKLLTDREREYLEDLGQLSGPNRAAVRRIIKALLQQS